MKARPMRVDPGHVQAHVLRSLDPAYAVYAFFRIEDAAEFRNLLKVLLDPDGRSRTIAGAPARIYDEAQWIAVEEAPDTSGEPPGTPEGPRLVHAHVAFTFSGLQQLGIDPKTLATFPEPFQQGMADRAAILGDTGVAAPEHWDGYLGSKRVHGVLWFDISRRAHGGVPEVDPEALAAQVLDNLADGTGLEVLHDETGQANYVQFSSGEVDRVEHFGFRDGVSQPWIEFGISGAPPPGGGTPQGDGWAPLAPGEFLLGYPDEDGLVQAWPCNANLRRGGTYMVFRKLEQDVVGFRNFLRAGRSASEACRLAAQMIGRWPDGTPLVRSPGGPNADCPAEPTLNDFRYKRDDPLGKRCPIAAHIRRANPRDSGDRDDVRRHRILRRGIAYGGDLLPDDSPGDGKKRGLLFVALNARIDQQFEFVQAHWLNRGEFLGQAGAGKDPILGACRGDVTDAFATLSQPGPVTSLARFVTMRGGDYFFLPGVEALNGLADGESFGLDEGARPPEDAIGTLETPEPLDPALLAGLSEHLLAPAPERPNWIPKTAPYRAFPGAAQANRTIAFVAQHPFVTQILKDDAAFGIDPYAERVSRATPWGQMLISLPSGNAERVKRCDIRDAAMQELMEHHQPQFSNLDALFAASTRSLMQHLLKPAARRGSLDIVGDVGRVVPILLAARVFGVTGPSWVSPTAVAARFGRADITSVPPSWLADLPPIADEMKPLVTVQAWTRFAFAQVFVNVVNAAELAALAERALAEMFGHLGRLIDDARILPRSTETLLACLVKLGDQPQRFGLDQQEYDRHARLILAEAAVGGVETVNKALTNVVNFSLDRPAVLEKLKRAAANNDDAALDALIREALRFDPVSPALFRLAKEGATIGGAAIPAGTIICALVKSAMHDPRVFADPEQFDAARAADAYLHFGDAQPAPAAPHVCWGRGYAMAELREMLKVLVVLPNLRRAAGPKGNVGLELHLPASLTVRFDTG
jgi:Dyp-type peroxidase family